MKIELRSIVTVSDIRKNYKVCRDKAQRLGKVFIFKNNKADAVLSSIDDYRKTDTKIEDFESKKNDAN